MAKARSPSSPASTKSLRRRRSGERSRSTPCFALDRSNVIDVIGRFLTPLLLLLPAAIVLWSVVRPLGVPVQTGVKAPFALGFVTGYQTGDVFAGLMFGIMFIEAITARGYGRGNCYLPVLLGAAAVAFQDLFTIYGGLENLGATGSGVLSEDSSQAGLIIDLVARLAGSAGATALAFAVLLACLTTSVGATAVLARYVAKWSGGRVSEATGAVITVLVATVQAFGGVDYITGFAGPISVLFYPVGSAS
ncbi:MAG: branched-chain amino acid transport system II carrier protein [Proteobacteria bacterium]|nr:branched-chain amino acid transport system II carrier protein [Pseudomonadota bacterium]